MRRRTDGVECLCCGSSSSVAGVGFPLPNIGGQVLGCLSTLNTDLRGIRVTLPSEPLKPILGKATVLG